MLPFGLFRVEGESMLPTYRPGDLLFGYCWYVHPKAGDIIVVMVENRPLVKRIKSIKDTMVEIVGDNPAASTDSRSFGPVPRTAIIARVIAKFPGPSAANRN